MDIGEVIALGSFLLAAVAALVALWQAGIASSARADAQTARDEAAKHEQAALAASEKAADAQEEAAKALREANDIARETLPPSPWDQTQAGSTVEVRNASRRMLYNVDGRGLPDELTEIQPISTGLPWAVMMPNESLFFDVTTSMAAEPVQTLRLTWSEEEGGEQLVWTYSLM